MQYREAKGAGWPPAHELASLRCTPRPQVSSRTSLSLKRANGPGLRRPDPHMRSRPLARAFRLGR